MRGKAITSLIKTAWGPCWTSSPTAITRLSISSFSTSGCRRPVAASLKRFHLDTVVAFSAGLTLPLDRAGWTATVFLLALRVGCASLTFRRSEPRLRWQGFSLVLFYLMVPTLAALVISYRHPKYGLRYLLLVTPPYYLLAAYPIPPRLVASVEQPVSRSMVAETLNEIVAHHRRVWLILWQERLADPARLVLNELVANTPRLGVGAEFHGPALLLFSLEDKPHFSVAAGSTPHHC
jgi:hypothetical protein